MYVYIEYFSYIVEGIGLYSFGFLFFIYIIIYKVNVDIINVMSLKWCFNFFVLFLFIVD